MIIDFKINHKKLAKHSIYRAILSSFGWVCSRLFISKTPEDAIFSNVKVFFNKANFLLWFSEQTTTTVTKISIQFNS